MDALRQGRRRAARVGGEGGHVKTGGGEQGERIAAFFDLDGTLVAGPSLEWRFLSELRRRGAIPARNYFLWLREAARLMPQGIGMVGHANKMYLRGVAAQSAAELRMAVPFYRSGIERVAWHVAQGHAIVLVSGTLTPLAQCAATVLALRLALRGLSGSIEFCATRLEEVDGRWTGRIVGEAMFGEAKARIVRRLAQERGIDLGRCYAYADSASDLPMLEAVGWPVAVNPSQKLQRVARRNDWPILWWREERMAAESQRAQRADESRTRGFAKAGIQE